MYTLIAENKYGDQLELTHSDAYVITGIDGIDPPDSVINTTRNANADGSVFNSAYVDNRTITITLAINSPAEINRIALYKYFKSKNPVTLYYQNGTRDVYITGYVQSMTIAYFEQKQIAQIVVFCPEPFFLGSENEITSFSTVNPLFEFPFAIEESDAIPFSEILLNVNADIINNGDVEVGALITIHALGAVTTPKIYNEDSGEYMILNTTMSDGDTIEINTMRGQKSITLISDGTSSNIIGYLQEGSTWFTLVPGDNVFTIDADSGETNMNVTFEVINKYEGV